ncbi:MAG: DNA repair protein RadC [Myxococcota bacterium]
MSFQTLRGEGPRERLRREGAEGLALVELLAVLLRTGPAGSSSLDLAARLVHRFASLDGLAEAGDAELQAVAGMGPAKVACLRAALELGSRLAQAPLRSAERLHSPEQVHACFGARLRRARQELFFVLLLDSRHRLIREVQVSRGSLNQSLVHPREVFAPALREAAAAIVAIHNHPSGDPSPSHEDHEVTRRLARAGEILGIRLLDHIVVGHEGYRSFARMGWLPPQAGRDGGR